MRALQQEIGANSPVASEELQTEQRSSQQSMMNDLWNLSLRDVPHDALRVHTGIVTEIDELHKGCSTGTENIVHMMTKKL